jgi:hypothetical protein
MRESVGRGREDSNLRPYFQPFDIAALYRLPFSSCNCHATLPNPVLTSLSGNIGKIDKEIPVKKKILITVVALILVTSVAGFTNGKSKTASIGRILNVSEVQANPDAYKRIVAITGVVAKLSKEDPKLFAIIDTAEAKHCKSTGCAKFYLPIKYDKQVPKEWDEINATGQFVEKGGLLFEASKIEILGHLKF